MLNPGKVPLEPCMGTHDCSRMCDTSNHGYFRWCQDGSRLDSLGYATCKDRKQKCEMIEINDAMFDLTWSISFKNVN